MDQMMRWLRMLGTTGAVANAHSLAEQREREQWVVDALMTRLSTTDRKATKATAA